MLSNFKKDFQGSNNLSSKFEPTHTYVDINVYNNDSNSMVPQPLIFNQTKNQNIINDCSEFHASVIRWQADSMIPVIIPEMELLKDTPGGIYNNYTKYYVSMGYSVSGVGNVVFIDSTTTGTTGEPVVFLPQNLNPTVYPNYKSYANGGTSFPASQQDVLNNPYYWISSIQWFLEMINNAYDKLWQVMNSAYKALFPIDFVPPNFRWNSSTNNIDLVAGPYYTNFPAVNINQIYLGMNAPLYNLLSSFNAYLSSNYTISNYKLGRPYILSLPYSDDLISSVTYSPGGVKITRVYHWSSENSPIASWTPVSSIVFASYTIPVNATESGSVYFLSNNNNNNSIANNAISNTMTDFEIQQTNGNELANSTLYYVPSAEYRLLDLNSNNPLSQLQFKMMWKDKYGQYHDYLLKYNGSASLKLLFRKKNFESSNIF